jgi:enamine deaminase RidA (YjgF/YER057c/UK114 family)
MFINMKQVAEAEGATLQDAVRLTIYVSDVVRLRPVVNKVQEELWGKGPYPPRTVLEVRKLDQDDIAEVDAIFYAPAKKKRAKD